MIIILLIKEINQMNSFRTFLNEAAKDIGNNALVISPDHRLVYLYNPSPELKTNLTNYDTSSSESNILFVFGLKEELGNPTFDAVQAQKGYGPLAYKVAMSIAGSLTPTQDGRITNAALNVWKKFYKSSDVKIEEFGAVQKYMFQRSTYSLKKKLNLTKNINAHKKFIKADSYNEMQTQLDELADGILMNAMNKIY